MAVMWVWVRVLRVDRTAVVEGCAEGGGLPGYPSWMEATMLDMTWATMHDTGSVEPMLQIYLPAPPPPYYNCLSRLCMGTRTPHLLQSPPRPVPTPLCWLRVATCSNPPPPPCLPLCSPAI